MTTTRAKKRTTKRASSKRQKKKVVATAKTPAGQKRQVWEGRATETPSGLDRSDLVESSSGKIVSKKRQHTPWLDLVNYAHKRKLPEFEYKGNLYIRNSSRGKNGTTLFNYKRAF
tara:strand:- start:53 stop:397 length:345 start_codon:yes stop_codon:yes gene_type:complete